MPRSDAERFFDKAVVPRVAIGYAVILVSTIIALFVVFRNQSAASRTTETMISGQLEMSVLTQKLEAAIARDTSDFRGHILAGDMDLIKVAQAHSDVIIEQINRIFDRSKDPKTKDLAMQVRRAYMRVLTSRSLVISQIGGPPKDLPALAKDFSTTVMPQSAVLKDLTRELSEHELDNLRLTSARVVSLNEWNLNLLEGIAISTIAFSIGLALWFSRRLAAGFQQTREALEKFRMTIEVSDDFTWEWDLATGQVRSFEGTFSTFGYGSLQDASVLMEKIHPEDRGRVSETLQVAVHSEAQKWSESFRILRSDGSYADVVGRSVIRRHRVTHQPISVLGALIDVSELKQAIRARDLMTGVVSHELKNPVAAISMIADLLERELADAAISDTARSALARMKPISHRMNRLLRDLLDITRIESKSLAIDVGTHDIHRIVEEVMFQFRPQAQEKKITLNCHLPTDIPYLLCDRDRMIQILSNLVSNAIKFTPEFGQINVNALVRETEVELIVSDSGPGIVEENLTRVFDRFWRTTRDRKDSSGLGLAIAKGLVEAHGGRIWAESRLGKDASFHFTTRTAPAPQQVLLPPAFSQPREERPPRPQEPAEAAPIRQSLQGTRILLVDDSKDALFLTKTLLEITGAEVIETESAQSALSALTTFSPHILITDIEMPQMNGIELLQEIRRTPELNEMPMATIALTAHESESELAKIRAAGFDRVMLKPVSFEQMVAALTPLVRKLALARLPPPTAGGGLTALPGGPREETFH